MCYIPPWEVCTMPVSTKHLKKPCHYKSLFILFNSASPAGIWPWNTSFHVVADNVLWNKDSLEFSYRLRRTSQRSCKHFDTTGKFCGSKTFQADLQFHVTHLCRIVTFFMSLWQRSTCLWVCISTEEQITKPYPFKMTQHLLVENFISCG